MTGSLPANADAGAAEPGPDKRILRDLGFFGHYLHLHRGGRNGKQHVLLMLLRHGSAMGQRELQERSCITSAALSEVLAKLESEGLVRRSRCERDRRQLTIELTPEGERRAVRTRDAWNLHDRELLSCLTGAELAELADLLDLMAEHWRALEEDKRGEGECGKN